MKYEQWAKQYMMQFESQYDYLSLTVDGHMRSAWNYQQKRIDELEEKLRTTEISLNKFVDAFNESRLTVGQSVGLGPSGEHSQPIVITGIE